jgi:hypothetical protein
MSSDALLMTRQGKSHVQIEEELHQRLERIKTTERRKALRNFLRSAEEKTIRAALGREP